MLLFFCCSGLLFPYVPIDLSLERKIKPGMTKTEVEAILGPPSVRSGDVWLYYVREKWAETFLVDFDKQGIVVSAREWDGW